MIIGSCCLPHSKSSRSGTVNVVDRAAVSSAVAALLSGTAGAGGPCAVFRRFQIIDTLPSQHVTRRS